MQQPCGRLVDHLDAVLQEIHGKLVRRGHVEVSLIKARARAEVELGRDVLADLLVLQRGHRRPQVEVVVDLMVGEKKAISSWIFSL